jgi:hypothetical protein
MQSSLRGTFTFMPSHRRNCCSRASRNYSARHFVCVSARARFSSSEISSSSSLNCTRKLIAFLSKSLLAFCPCVYRQCTAFQTDPWVLPLSLHYCCSQEIHLFLCNHCPIRGQEWESAWTKGHRDMATVVHPMVVPEPEEDPAFAWTMSQRGGPVGGEEACCYS